MTKKSILPFIILALGISLSCSAQITVIQDITCNGQSNGAIIASPAGWGTAPYSYLWNTTDTTQALHNLPAGNYTVTITDNLGTDSICSLTLSQPDPIIVTVILLTPSDCDGHNNGAINVAVIGGIPPYTFQWREITSDSIYNTQNLSNIRGGNYQLTLTDTWGCVKITNVIVPNLAFVPVSFIIDSFVCNGLTGSVMMQADSAAPGNFFTYSWSSPYNTGTFTSTNLIFGTSTSFLAGTYLITTIENATGCANYSNVIIDQTATPLVVSETVVHNMCFGDMAGSITLVATGGMPLPDYQCAWTGPGGFTSVAFSIAGLSSGNYIYTVDDDSACTFSGTVLIEPSMPIQGVITLIGVTCEEGQYGQAVASFSGGSGLLNYLWSSGETTPDLTLPYPGTFILTITDGLGCQAIDSVTVMDGQEICLLIPNMVTANGDAINDVFTVKGACDLDEFLMVIYNSEGENVFSSADCNATWDPLSDTKTASNTVFYYYIRVSKGGQVYEYKNSININY
jgi:large repetitive protein